jgi:hypothetical protein
MRKFRYFGALLVALLGVGCAGAWSKSQKQAAVPVAVLPATMKEGYYDDPQKMSLEAAGTTGFVSGFAGGLIGGAVATAVVAGLQNDYENDNEVQFNELESRVKGIPLGQELQAALTRELEKIPHFQGQISGSAATQFKTEIVGLTFGRLSGKSPDNALMLIAKFTCVTANGQTLLSKVVMAKGYDVKPSPAQAPLASYVRDPELLKRHFSLVAAEASAQCGEAVRGKLGLK